jgi:hypothetical protein
VPMGPNYIALSLAGAALARSGQAK